MTTQDLITRAEFIYKKARAVGCRLLARARSSALCFALPLALLCALPRALTRSPPLNRPQYQKYSEEKNKDRLLNPGDAFSELCMDFSFQIAALMEVRASPGRHTPRARAARARAPRALRCAAARGCRTRPAALLACSSRCLGLRSLGGATPRAHPCAGRQR